MATYVAQRLILALPVLLGITLVVFIAVRLAPGDTAIALVGLEAADPSVLEAIRKEYALDKSLPEQYLIFMRGLARLDLGTSATTKQPVISEIAVRLPYTFTLALLATAFATVVGVTLGVLAARWHRTRWDYFLMVVAMGSLSIPNYVIGLLFILLFAVTLGVLPATGADTPAHFILPVTTVGLAGAGVIARQTRSAVLEVLMEDYVRTARAKGLDEPTIFTRHALRNALIPIITTIGLIFGHLLGGTVIAESIFSIPGLGKFMLDRVMSRDYPAVQGAVLVIALNYTFVNIIVDLAYVAADKRLRLR